MGLPGLYVLAVVLLTAGLAPASAQRADRPTDPPFTLPDDVDVRKQTIWRDGIRL